MRIDRQGCRRSAGDGDRGSRSDGSNEGRRQVADDRVGARGASHQIDVHRVRGDFRLRGTSHFAPPVPPGPRGKGTHVKVKAAVLREVTKGYSIEELELEPPKAGEALVKYALHRLLPQRPQQHDGQDSHGAAHGGRPRVRRGRRGRRRGRHQGQGRRSRGRHVDDPVRPLPRVPRRARQRLHRAPSRSSSPAPCSTAPPATRTPRASPSSTATSSPASPRTRWCPRAASSRSARTCRSSRRAS